MLMFYQILITTQETQLCNPHTPLALFFQGLFLVKIFVFALWGIEIKDGRF